MYGIRQSSLIQCSPPRRLFLGGGDRKLYRFPVCDNYGDVYDVSCSIKKRNGSGGNIDRRRRGRYSCKVSEEDLESYELNGIEDAEAVISLLSEEVSEEYLGARKWNKRITRRVEVEKREGSGSEYFRGKKSRVKAEEDKSFYTGESYRRRRRGVNSNLLESDSQCEFESKRVDSRKEAYGRTEERQAIARGNNRRGRTKSSSGSSYYSVSSPGKYESGEELHDKDRQSGEEPSSWFREDLHGEDSRFKAPVREGFQRCSNHDEVYHEVAQQRYTAAGDVDGWDCRKKSEKKLTEVPTEEGTRKQYLQNQSRLHRAQKTDYREMHPTPKQFIEAENKSTLAEDLDKETRKHYSKISMQHFAPSGYRSKLKEVAEKQGIRDSDVRMTSQSEMRYGGIEEKRVSERRYEVGTVAGNDNLSKKPQQVTTTSAILEDDSERISNIRRQYTVRVPEEDMLLDQSSADGAEGLYQRRGERFTGQMDLRRKSEHFSETSKRWDVSVGKSSGLQYDSQMKNHGENPRMDHVSYQESKNQHLLKEQEHQLAVQSRKGTQDASRQSLVHIGDMKSETESQRTPEKRTMNQGNVLTSVVKQLEDEREKQNTAHEKAVRTQMLEDNKKYARLSSSHEKSLGESSNSQSSLSLVSQARVQQADVYGGKEERSSESILMPPPSQIAARGSQEVSCKSSESGSGAFYSPSEWRTTSSHDESHDRLGQTETYEEPLNLVTNEDALGSLRHQVESSMQYVGEFLEKASQELSTYEVQKEKISDTKVVHEEEKQSKKDLGQYGSEDFHSKGPEARKSSESSEAKGPSDEMWHVRDPSAQPIEAEASKGSKEVKRSGRSVWNIMADIVRLRWGPRAETPKSAARSNQKSSSNESTSSEAWFSGYYYDKTSDVNMKRERRRRRKKLEATSSQQLQLDKSFVQTEGEASHTMRSNSNELGPDMPSSSVIEGGSTSEGITSPSGEENISQKKYIEGSSSGTEEGPLPLLLPARSTSRSPHAEEISETRGADVSGSGSMYRPEEPLGSKKDPDFKQKKLQRNKQVMRDRFDEWEEAYQHEREQQNIDEMFMREALLEAKKAADYWEVPVGAILVQDGKIIARGYNL